MRGSARAVVPALVVLALVAVVAVASTGATSTGDERVRAPGATVLDTFFTLALLAVVAGAVLLVYGLMQRKDIRDEIASRRHSRMSLLGWIVFVFVFTAVVYLRGWDFRPRQDPVTDVVPTGERRPPGARVSENASTYEPHLAWIPIAVVSLLLAAAVVAYVVSRRRERAAGRDGDALAQELVAALEETLDDLRAEPDPRRAVIAAYVRLERALAASGVPRRPSEAEEEYLDRTLRSVDVSAASARTLTRLFERARFSEHTVDAGMKEDAIAAFERVRDELAGARAGAELAGAAA